MKRTQHSGCFIFFIELNWLNLALDTNADFHSVNTEHLDVSLYSYWYRLIFLRLYKYSHSLFDK